jgi:hypothetical protein
MVVQGVWGWSYLAGHSLLRGFQCFLVLFCLCVFPAPSVVVVDVAILAQSSSVQFLVLAFGWFFDSSQSVVAVGAHALRVVRSILVAAVVGFLSIIQ